MIQSFNRQSGYYFTLTIIVALFFAAAMFFLSRSKESVERQSVQNASAPGRLGKIEIALRNFVAIQKRLPCPADPADASGREPTGAAITCTKAGGVVPWGSIGLSAADALDSWDRKVSYRVYDGATGFTQTAGLDASNCNTSSYLTTGAALSASGACADPYHESRYADFLTGKGLSVNDRGSVASGIGYVLISHGASGYGSYGPDSGATRSTLPNASSKEYPNTQALGTYWNQEASASTVQPDDAAHFDDVVFYKRASELLDETRLAGRDWGTIAASVSFSAGSITPGASTTLTISLASTIPNNTKLARDLTITLPSGLAVAATPNVSSTCGAVIANAGATKVILSAGGLVPARAGTVLGSCKVMVDVTSSTAGNYSASVDQYALEVTPNMAATLSPQDAAAVHNMIASSASTLNVTPTPPATVDSAFNRSTVGAAAGTTITANDTGRSSIAFSAYTVSAFASSPRDISAAASGGIGVIVPGSNNAASITTSGGEGLRFLFNADYRYLGLTLLGFDTTNSGSKQQMIASFYDDGGILVAQIVKQSCQTAPADANLTFNPGSNFRRVDIQALAETVQTNKSSSFLLGGITACATGTEAACVVSGASSANDCP